MRDSCWMINFFYKLSNTASYPDLLSILLTPALSLIETSGITSHTNKIQTYQNLQFTSKVRSTAHVQYLWKANSVSNTLMFFKFAYFVAFHCRISYCIFSWCLNSSLLLFKFHYWWFFDHHHFDCPVDLHDKNSTTIYNINLNNSTKSPNRAKENNVILI